jgi:hypothetical protein
MKKIKLILTSSAIILAVIGAFALRENKPLCTTLPQYHFDGANYVPAGQPGVDYVCETSQDTCTFIEDAGSFAPCVLGTYLPASGKKGARPK